MRYFAFCCFCVIVLSVTLSSCGGEGAAATPSSTPSSTPTSTPSSTPSTQSSQVTRPTGEIRRDPIMGGPAMISIRAANAPQGSSFLIGILGDQRFRIDTTLVDAQGNSTFNNPDGYPQGHYFVYYPNNKNFQVLLGEDQEFTLSLDIDNIAETIKVDGSVDNKLLYDNIIFETSLRPQFAAVASDLQANAAGSPAHTAAKARQEELVNQRKAQLAKDFKAHPNSFYTAFKKAGQNPELRTDLPEKMQVPQYRKDFWANVDFADTRLMRTPVVMNKLKRYMDELTPQHVDSLVQSAVWLIDRAEPYPDYFKFFANWVPLTYEPTKTSIMDPEKILVTVIRRYFTKEKAFWADSMSIYGFQQRAQEMGGSLFGMKGPDISSTDQFGKKQTIYEKTADYIIVYMYNPDCEHCQEQSPKLVDFYNQHKNNGIDVYAVAIDTDKEKWNDYITKTGMTFTNVYDPSNRSIYGKYYVDHTPELYVLNKDRIIIGKNLKVNQIMTVIDRDKEK